MVQMARACEMCFYAVFVFAGKGLLPYLTRLVWIEVLQCLWQLPGIEERDLAEGLQEPLEKVAIVTEAIVDAVEATLAIIVVLPPWKPV